MAGDTVGVAAGDMAGVAMEAAGRLKLSLGDTKTKIIKKKNSNVFVVWNRFELKRK